MTIKKNDKRLEVYGVTKDQKSLQSLLKYNNFKRYPPKQCWTRYGVEAKDFEFLQWETQVFTVQENEQSVDKCIECTNDQREEIEHLKDTIAQQQEIIKSLQAMKYEKQNNTKKKTTIKKNKIKVVDYKNFVAKNPTLPILERVIVKNWILEATDMEKFIKTKTDLEDGVYKSLSPIVKDNNLSIADSVIIPIIDKEHKGYKRIVIKRSHLVEITEAVQETVDQKYVKSKNFSPLFTWVRVLSDYVFGTDSYCLYRKAITPITETIAPWQCSNDNLLFNIPVTSIQVLQAHCRWDSNDDVVIETKWSDKSSDAHMLQITSWDTITWCVCIIGNIPDAFHEKIIPTYDESFNKIDKERLKDLLEIERVEKKSYIEYSNTMKFSTVAWKQMLQCKWDVRYCGDKPIVCSHNWRTTVWRPLAN